MQRPPSLSWLAIESLAEQHHFTGPLAQLRGEIADLSYKSYSHESENHRFDLAVLASLTPRLWPASYSRFNGYGAEYTSIDSLHLWKAEPMELACEVWLRSRTPSDPSHLAVYHMMNIVLHSNITVIQSFVHSAPDSTGRDPTKNAAAREAVNWAKDRHYLVASWHADSLITAIERALTDSQHDSTQVGARQGLRMVQSSHSDQRRLDHEAPHVPYAIYYATLVLWCGQFTAGQHLDSTRLSAKAVIARGERALSSHRVHIAQLLAQVLRGVA